MALQANIEIVRAEPSQPPPTSPAQQVQEEIMQLLGGLLDADPAQLDDLQELKRVLAAAAAASNPASSSSEVSPSKRYFCHESYHVVDVEPRDLLVMVCLLQDSTGIYQKASSRFSNLIRQISASSHRDKRGESAGKE